VDTRREGLEIDEDLKFQLRFWRVQRVGLALMTLTLLAALLGLLGASGPLSRGEAHSGGLHIRYARFARRSNSTALELRIAPSAVHGGLVRVWVSSDYLDDLQLERASPQPEAVVAGGERATFVFRASPDGTRPLRVVLELKPRALLGAPGRAGLAGGPELSFSTFVYP
jgi:hypothetical protein